MKPRLRQPVLSLVAALSFALTGVTQVAAQDQSQKVQPALKAPAEVKVVQARFGVFNEPSSGRPPFADQRVIPLVAGQSYGWVLFLNRPTGKIKWREEFTLPAKPGSWGTPETEGRRTTLNQGTTTFTEREVSFENGLVLNAWAVIDGDPAGKHRIRVLVEGEEVANFEFELKAP